MGRTFNTFFITLILGILLVLYGYFFSVALTRNNVFGIVAVAFGVAMTIILESVALIKAQKDNRQ